MVDLRAVNSHDASTAVGVVNKLDSGLAVAKFFKSRVWDKVPEGSSVQFFGPPCILHCVVKKFGYLQSKRVLRSGTLSLTPDL